MYYNRQIPHSQIFFENCKLKRVDSYLKGIIKPVDSYLKFLGKIHEQN